MTKKEFSNGLDNLLRSTIKKEEIEVPINQEAQMEKSVNVRATFILDSKQLETIKAIAYWERIQIKNVLEKALNQYIKSYSEEDILKILSSYKSNKS
jgi:hypothetical protein